jgi:hypothetical protein
MMLRAMRQSARFVTKRAGVWHACASTDHCCCVQIDLSAGQRKDFDAFMRAIPCVSMHAFCETEVCCLASARCLLFCSLTRHWRARQGEEGGEILEGDIATCTVHINLERMSAVGEEAYGGEACFGCSATAAVPF